MKREELIKEIQENEDLIVLDQTMDYKPIPQNNILYKMPIE